MFVSFNMIVLATILSSAIGHERETYKFFGSMLVLLGPIGTALGIMTSCLQLIQYLINRYIFRK